MEVVGALSVVLGLLFVGMELRANTQAVKAGTFQSLTDVSNDFLVTVAGDPELSRIYTAGRSDSSALSPADSARFYLLSRAYWVRMQNVHSQFERGTLSDKD